MKKGIILGIIALIMVAGFAGAAAADDGRGLNLSIMLSGVNLTVDDTVAALGYITSDDTSVVHHTNKYTIFCDDYGTVTITVRESNGYALNADTEYEQLTIKKGVVTVTNVYSGVDIYLSAYEKYHVNMTDYDYGTAPPSSVAPTLEPSATDGTSVEYYYSFSPSGDGNKWSEKAGNSLDALRETDSPYYIYAVVNGDGDSFETTRTEFRVNKAAGITLGKISVDDSKMPIVVTLNKEDVGRNLEYSLNDGNTWISLTPEESKSGEFTLPGLENGKTYTLLLRVVASSNYYSSPILTQDFTTPDVTPVYLIRYNANGGTNSPADSSVEEGKSLKLPDSSEMKRSGYTFAGWWTASDGGTEIKDGYIVKDNMLLYAHWNLIPFPVEFNANGGSGVMESVMANAGSEITLPSNTFTRTGYVFAGWATSKNGSVQYTDRATVNLKPDSTGKVTLNAVWVEETFTITGKVTGTDGDKARASLVYGNIILSQSDWLTMEGGFISCSFSAPNGVYDVVVETEKGQKVTCLVTVSGKNATFTMKLPESGVNSEIVVKKDAPNVVVGSLDSEAEANREPGKDTTTRLLVESHEEKELAVDAEDYSEVEKVRQEEIQDIIVAVDDGSGVLEFMSLDVIKETAVDEVVVSEETVLVTSNILEVVMPYDLTGKTDIKVYRKHADSVDTLTLLKSKPKVDEYRDGTYYVDYKNGNIYIYTQKFSMYAVGYHESDSADIPSDNTDNRQTDETSTAAKSPFPLPGVLIGLGVIGFLVMRRNS